MTTYAVDRRGHTSTADGPLLLCYDGSDRATRAIEHAGALFAGRRALVVTVWEPPKLHPTPPAAERARRLADDGVRIAQEAGLEAEPAPVEATGPVWKTILEVAERHDAATIVLGSEDLADCALSCSEVSPAPSCITRSGPRSSSHPVTRRRLRGAPRGERHET